MYNFPKLIELDEYTKFSEPTLQIVRPRDISVPHIKVASEALDYIKHVKPQPGKTIILVLAMTAGEYYGANKNGDGWSEKPLTIAGGKAHITADEVLPKHYKTFETNARVFQHHINKDPSKSIGDILKAFYHWGMHRVELLLSLDNLRAENIVAEIESGKFPAVSMGCLPAGNMITLGDGTRKPIEEIVVGDTVLTHKGRARRVTETHVRKYTGDMYTVKPAAGPEITITHEHPFLTDTLDNLRPEKTDANSRKLRTWDTNAKADPDWVHTKCLDDSHLLMAPVIQETVTPDYVTSEFAQLFGAYVADGHINRNKEGKLYGVELNVSINNPILDSIGNICTALSTKNAPVITQNYKSALAMKISIHGTELAPLFAKLAGTHAIDKKLHHSVMLWNPTLQREFLGSYANGDGCGTKSGALQLSTASQDLAWQLCSILHRLNIPPSIQCVTHKAGGGFNAYPTTEYSVFIGKQWAQSLKDVCYKIQPSEIRAVRNDRFFFGHNLATPIRSITVEYVTGVDVYNFEVEDDESYVAGGMSVHNCKIKFDICNICGNAAPSRAQYCDHAKYQLGQYLPNGKQVLVWNPSPRFFDLSCVRRPADRVGFMMKKVAESVPEIRSSAVLGERIEFLQNKMADAKKMSIINKVIRGDTVAAKEDDGDLNVVKNYADQVAKPAAQAMPPLSDATIQEMLQYRPAAVLASLASMGIFLTTPEFIKFFIGKAAPGVQVPDELLQRAVDTQQLVFEMLAQNPDLVEEVRNTDFLDLSTNNIDPELVEKFSPLLEKRSQQDDYMRHRLVKCALEPGQGNWDILEIVDPRTGEHYRTTRRAVRDAREALPKAKLHTTLRSLLGGGALMSGAYKLFGARAPTNRMAREYHRAVTAPYPYISTTGEEVPVGTELAKVGMNLKGAIMQLTHDWCMAPAASKTASRGQFEPNLSTACFDTVADWLGKVICL